MKRIALTLSTLLLVLFFVSSCDTDAGTGDKGGEDNGTEAAYYEADLSTYQVGWTEGGIDATTDVTLTENTEDNSALDVQITWPDAAESTGKAYVSHYSDGSGENPAAYDFSGRTLTVEMKFPSGFLTADADNTDGDGNAYWAGFKVYAKSSDWEESNSWFGAWNISDAVAGNDQSANGITYDETTGIVSLSVDFIDYTADDAIIYEHGIVFEQNGNNDLADDLVFTVVSITVD